MNTVLGVHANSVTTPGYRGFNSKTNPIFNPMVTMVTKMALLDLDSGTFTTPGTVCASSNLTYYASTKFGHPANVSRFDLTHPGYYGAPDTFEQAVGFGHDSPRFVRKPTPFYNPGT